CPAEANEGQSDVDGDGMGDACDDVDDREPEGDHDPANEENNVHQSDEGEPEPTPAATPSPIPAAASTPAPEVAGAAVAIQNELRAPSPARIGEEVVFGIDGSVTGVAEGGVATVWLQFDSEDLGYLGSSADCIMVRTGLVRCDFGEAPSDLSFDVRFEALRLAERAETRATLVLTHEPGGLLEEAVAGPA